MSIPIPKAQQELLEAGQSGNASFFFARMTAYETIGGKVDKEAIARLGSAMNLRFPASKAALEKLHARQAATLGAEVQGGGTGLEIRAQLTSPYVSGLGSGHPTETGFILDRNTGLPYIPASSIKGVLRLACALHIAEIKPNAVRMGKDGPEIPDSYPLLRRYFGDTDTGKADGVRGQLVFLDAFPAEIPGKLLKTDIMNPHFGKYYEGKKGPVETESPNPIRFLAVPPKTEFIFRCFALPLPENADAVLRHPFDKTDEDHIAACFKIACAQLGFGAKTAIGYGRFDVISIKTGKAVIPPPPPKPWDGLLNALAEVEDWGRLCDVAFNNPKAEEWRSEDGVALAVLDACCRVQKKYPKKWKEDQEKRDTRCREWLKPAGLTWPPAQQKAPTPPPGPTSPKPASQGWTFKTIDEYRGMKLDLRTLSSEDAKALKRYFRKLKWHEAQGTKKAAYEELEKILRKQT